KSSLRRTAAPMPVAFMAVSSLGTSLPARLSAARAAALMCPRRQPAPLALAPAALALTMLWWPGQRPGLPSSSPRVGLPARSLPLRRRMSTAVMIMPGVQKPHCRPWFSRNASCIGWSLSPSARLSMVRTSVPSAVSTSMVQDFTAIPLTCTTQAPHWEVSQPTWVPVSRRFSRRNWTSRVRGSTSAVTALPFTVSLTAGIGTLLKIGLKGPVFGLARSPGDFPGAKSGRFCPIFRFSTRRVLSPAPFRSRRIAAGLPLRGRGRGRDGGGELGEEIVRHLLGGAGDQPLAELGGLAADLRLHIVGEQRAAVLVGQRHHGAALGEAGDAALALAGNLVAVRRVEVGELHLALPLGLDRTDLGRRNGREFGVG